MFRVQIGPAMNAALHSGTNAFSTCGLAIGACKTYHYRQILTLKHQMQIPILCNSTHGTWHVTLNKVECREDNCLICGDRPTAHRFMARSGLHGFTKHAGLSVQPYWKNVFKVDLPGMIHWHNFVPSACMWCGPKQQQVVAWLGVPNDNCIGPATEPTKVATLHKCKMVLRGKLG